MILDLCLVREFCLAEAKRQADGPDVVVTKINMKIISTPLKDLYILEPKVFGDQRGYFMESFRAEEFDNELFGTCFIQDNESKSNYGVIRGLHYQMPPFSQAKLVRVIQGEILDVAVDMRRSSPTFGKHFSLELSSENKLQLFIPKGFAHGFSVLSNEAVVLYKCDNYYAPESEAGVLWSDPQLAVDWKIPAGSTIISEKDSKNPYFADAIIFE